MRRLRRRGVCAIDVGLTDREFARVEEEFGFRFAADHRAFLAAGLPVNAGMPPPEPGVYYTHPRPWPDWRHDDSATLRRFLVRPVRDVLFAVERSAFWRESWGPRPERRAAAVAAARRRLEKVPRMVPVYGHRYLPDRRAGVGHPVLSMWERDIICYGLDLADYIDREFGPEHPGQGDWHPRVTVEFWRDLL
jgi:hypothetical protein